MTQIVRETLGSMLAEAASALSAAGFDEPRRRARRLVSAAFDLSATELLSRSEHELAGDKTAHIRTFLARMIEGEPLSRIFGRREFWGLGFDLSADTLDPRPESETVIETVLRRISERGTPLRFLDLGTGTGCLLLALLAEFPAATGVGIDIAPGAVRVARGNAAALGVAGRARFLVGDWGRSLSGRFAAVVTNPPYIPSWTLPRLPREVSAFDPRQALDGGADGLAAYRSIAPGVAALLAPGGIFAVEVGAGQAEAVAAILRADGLVIDGVELDLAGVARCVVARPAPA